MKRLKWLDEIHEIIENISTEENGLTPEQQVKNIREESGRFLQKRKLSLKRVNPKEVVQYEYSK